MISGMGTTISLSTIEALENELRLAQDELHRATEARLNAINVEEQWRTEVNSLKALIEVRRKRLGIVSDEVAVQEHVQLNVVEPISHVDWIYDQVLASGDSGVTPVDLYKIARKHGRTMHENYPYVALSSLVERKKIVKRDGRYYKV
jgi:hypothetical protein